jgi:cytochrome c-type biogenesis protein
VAGAEESAMRGALLLFVYSLGMGIPFVLAALFAGPFMRLMVRFRGQLRHVEQVMGGLLVVTGILFITGQMTLFSAWLQSLFPEGWLLG